MRTVGKFGLRPVPHGMRWKLKFSDYVDATALPPIPEGDFGHTGLVTKPWEMYKNDELGDCVVAAKQHTIRMWVAEGTGIDSVVFDDGATVANYELLGNYNPDNPNSDQGCDMVTAAQLWLDNGLVDAYGTYHKPGIALELQAGNWEQLRYATYYFDGVDLGILVTGDMQEAFSQGKPWGTTQYNPNEVEGGHCVPVEDWQSGMAQVITWADKQSITQDLYTTPGFNTVTMCYASQEKLRNGVDLEGISWSDMRSDIRKLLNV